MQGRWTTFEIGCLHDNAGDGAERIAQALGRSVRSVECCAILWNAGDALGAPRPLSRRCPHAPDGAGLAARSSPRKEPR